MKMILEVCPILEEKFLLPNHFIYYVKTGLRDNSLQARGGKKIVI